MQNYYYKLKKTANDKLINNKDRRKNSLNREYLGDYILYRENFALKSIVGKEAKVHFADVANYVDKKGKVCRYCFVVSDLDVVIVKIGKNKDKNTKKQKPLIYELVQRIDVAHLKAIQFSKLADNFFLLQVDGVTPFCENRKKTEILALLLKLKPELNVVFNNDFSVIFDAKKPKPTLFQFVSTPGMLPNGQFLPKKHRCNVSPDLGQTAYPNLKEPEKVTQSYSSHISNAAPSSTVPTQPLPSSRPFGGGAPSPYGGSPAPAPYGSPAPAPYGGTSAPAPYGGGSAPPSHYGGNSAPPPSHGGNSGYGAPAPLSARGQEGGYGGLNSSSSTNSVPTSSPPMGGRGPPPFGVRGPPPIGGASDTPTPAPRPQPVPGGRPLPGNPMVMPPPGGGGEGGDLPEWKKKLMERKQNQ